MISCVIAFVVEICDRNCDSFCDSSFGPDQLHYRIHFRIRCTFSVHVYAQEHTSIYIYTYIRSHLAQAILPQAQLIDEAEKATAALQRLLEEAHSDDEEARTGHSTQ